MNNKQSKLKKHKCRAKCARTSGKFDNRIIKCFGCQDEFHAQCFNLNLDAVSQKSFFQTTSHVQFFCSICYNVFIDFNTHKNSNNQSCVTHSSNTQTTSDNNNDNNDNSSLSTKPAPSKHPSSVPSSDGPSNTQTTREASSYDSNRTNSSSSNDEFKSKVLDMLKVLDNKIDNINLNKPTAEPSNIFNDEIERMNTIAEKLEFNVGKINNNQIDYTKVEDLIRKHACMSKIFNKKSFSHNDIKKTSSSNDPFNWSLSFNTSIPNDIDSNRPDLFQLWHSFEDNTWSSFDHIFRSLRKISDTLGVDRDGSNEQQTDDTQNQKISSPLVESIQIENIEAIKDNVNSLNNKFDSLYANIMNVASYSRNISSNLSSAPSQSALTQENNEISSPDLNLNLTETIPNSLLVQELIEAHNDNATHINQIPAQSNSFNSSSHDSIFDISGDHIDGSSQQSSNVNIDSTCNHELYLTRLPIDITDEDIFHYIKEKGITDTNNIKLSKLVKKNTDLTSLTFISFKIDTTDSIAKVFTSKDFWPDKCVIKKFVQKKTQHTRKSNANIPTIASVRNFRLPSQHIKQAT